MVTKEISLSPSPCTNDGHTKSLQFGSLKQIIRQKRRLRQYIFQQWYNNGMYVRIISHLKFSHVIKLHALLDRKGKNSPIGRRGLKQNATFKPIIECSLFFAGGKGNCEILLQFILKTFRSFPIELRYSLFSFFYKRFYYFKSASNKTVFKDT